MSAPVMATAASEAKPLSFATWVTPDCGGCGDRRRHSRAAFHSGRRGCAVPCHRARSVIRERCLLSVDIRHLTSLARETEAFVEVLR